MSHIFRSKSLLIFIQLKQTKKQQASARHSSDSICCAVTNSANTQGSATMVVFKTWGQTKVCVRHLSWRSVVCQRTCPRSKRCEIPSRHSCGGNGGFRGKLVMKCSAVVRVPRKDAESVHGTFIAKRGSQAPFNSSPPLVFL